jgi:hypothetical protein
LRSLRIEPDLVAAGLEGLDAECLRAALPAQPDLCAPAKLALAPGGGAELWAEVPRQRDLAPAKRLAERALDQALAWLSGAAAAPAPSARAASRGEEIEAALAALPWEYSRDADGSHRLHARDPRDPARILVAERTGGCVAVSTATWLRLPRPRALDALAHFALEANRRLRLARLSVAPRSGGAAQVVWDAILPAKLPADPALGELAAAVAGARALTARPLAALADPRVAETYLGARASRARPDRAGHNPRSRPRPRSPAKEEVP